MCNFGPGYAESFAIFAKIMEFPELLNPAEIIKQTKTNHHLWVQINFPTCDSVAHYLWLRKKCSWNT